jgi:hypothetical protein
MSAANGKLRSRRSMRVATIFTGVAACTAGATQVANAQEVHPANEARPTYVYGSIRDSYACGFLGTHKTWLHVSTTSYNSGGAGGTGVSIRSVCFGFRGSYYSPPYTGIRAECGGNNYGFLDGSADGRPRSTTFGPGTTYRTLSWSHLYLVRINSWAGNDTCPEAPDFGE